MATFKNIRIKKPGGGSRLQRVKVLASGKYRFVKNTKSSSPKKAKKSTKRRRKRGGGGMARRRKRRSGGGKSITQQAFKWIRMGALVAPAISDVIRGSTPQEKLTFAIESYTGYNMERGDWNWEHLARGWTPYLAAILATHGIPKISSIIRRL